MRLAVSADHRRICMRGAALVLVGGLAAGCSSNSSRFQDGIFSGVTKTPQQSTSMAQAYPGDASRIDGTYTGSVQTAAAPGRHALVPIPSANISANGSSIAMAPAPQTLPAPSVPGTYQMAAAQPGPALAPVARASLDQPTYQQSGLAPVSGGQAPLQTPSGQVAVLPAASPMAAPSQPAPAAGGTYTVVSGDTLHGISRRAGVGVEALKRANGLSDGMIRIGQKLTIPAGGTIPAPAQPTQIVSAPAAQPPAQPAVQQQVAAAPAPRTDSVTTSSAPSAPRQDSAQVAAYTPPQSSAREIAALDTSDAIAPNSTGIGKMRWPVRGRVISGFGASEGGKPNDGIDISVPEGTSVRAAENGVVIYAGDGLKEFGNTVLVRHEDGLVTVYGHNSQIKVQRGANVKRGDEIALSGLSGAAATPRLRFEVRKDSTPVNPMTYLE